jgi:nicotinamidase-related amidase
VLVDLHEHAGLGCVAERDFTGALQNCRRALAHARRFGFPVAFTRKLEQASGPPGGRHEPSWLSGFLPSRSEMVFERFGLSCYSSPAFAEMMDHAGESYVLAGLFAETSCLATALDGALRKHRVAFLEDASASRAMGRASPADTHDITTGIMALHVEVTDTTRWIRASAPSTLRLIASAGNEATDSGHGK